MFLVFFGPPGALVLIAAVSGLVAHAVRRIRQRCAPRLASPRPLGLVSVAALSAAVLVFGYADAWYSPGLYGDKTCLARMGVRAHPRSSGHFPLSTVCSGVEIVPAWVNPALAALGALAVLTLVAVPVAYAVRRLTAVPVCGG
ncbi:hypothetical protein ACWIG3_22815 [Streptomyces celluloflavus]